jgi:hypothetical protein
MAKETFGTVNLSDLMQNAGTDWSGTFGTDSFRPAAIATAEQRATKNAPLDDVQTPWKTSTQTSFQFGSTPMPELDRETEFRQNLREATLTGQRALQQTTSGAEQLSRNAAQNYQVKASIDQNSKNADFNNQLSLLNRNGGFSGGGQSYGVGGTVDPYGYNIGSSSVSRGMFDAGKLADYNLSQSNNARNDAKFYEAQQAGNIALSKQQLANQRQFAEEQRVRDIDAQNRQASLNAQTAGNDYIRQAQELALQRLNQQQLTQLQLQSQQQIAKTQAQTQAQIAQTQANASMYGANANAMGNIYGSMFGALNGAGTNTRYWS